MASGWELVATGTNAMIRGLKTEFSHQCPMFNQRCLQNGTSGKHLEQPGLGSIWVGEHINTSRCRKSVTIGGDMEAPHLLFLSTCPTWLVLSCTSSNKPIILSTALSWILWVTLGTYWSWGGVTDTPEFAVVWAEVRAWGLHSQLACEVGAVLGEQALHLRGLCWFWVVSVRTEFHRWALSWR